MVLDHGQIKEFNNPNVLLANSESSFYAMCKDAGLVGSGNNGTSNNGNGHNGNDGGNRISNGNSKKKSGSNEEEEDSKPVGKKNWMIWIHRHFMYLTASQC